MTSFKNSNSYILQHYYNDFRGSDQLDAINNDDAFNVRSRKEARVEGVSLNKQLAGHKEALQARARGVHSTSQASKVIEGHEREQLGHFKRSSADLMEDGEQVSAQDVRSGYSDHELSLANQRATVQRSYDDSHATEEKMLQLEFAERGNEHRKKIDERDAEHRSSLEAAIRQRDQGKRLSESAIENVRIIERLQAQVKSLEQQRDESKEEQEGNRRRIEDLEKRVDSMKDLFANEKKQALTAQRAQLTEQRDKALQELRGTLERHAAREKSLALSRLQDDLSEKHNSALEKLRVEVSAAATKQKDNALR